MNELTPIEKIVYPLTAMFVFELKAAIDSCRAFRYYDVLIACGILFFTTNGNALPTFNLLSPCDDTT